MMLKNQAYTRRPSLLVPFAMPICESNDVFLAYTRAQNSLIKTKQKGSHQAAVDARSGSPEPRTRSIDRCAAADAALVAVEAASRGCPTSAAHNHGLR